MTTCCTEMNEHPRKRTTMLTFDRNIQQTSPSCAVLRMLTVAALLLAPVVGEAAEVRVRKLDLFTARQGGYYTYRIPGIIETLDGTLLAFVTARDKDIWDYGNYDVLIRRSSDGGKTWTGPERFLHSGKDTVDNCVMIVDQKQKGVVHNLYCINYAHTYYRRSTDNARTFSKAVEITKPFTDFRSEYHFILQAVGPGHAIQLDNGRLLVPTWLSPKKEQFPSAVSTIYSDDGGDTWNRGAIVVRSGDPPNHPMEGVVAQLSDGRVMMNIRNEADVHRRAVSISPNGISDWSIPKFDPDLKEPICLGSLVAVPQSIAGAKGILLFANPNNTERTVELGAKRNRDRKNMTVQLSLNDGADWAKSLVLEPGFSAYSDLCVTSDGTVHCFYERGSMTSYYDPAALTLASFKLRDLIQAANARVQNNSPLPAR